MEYILLILGIVFFVALQFLFACSEMSIVSSNRLKIHYLAKQGNKNAQIIEYLLNNSHKFLGTTLVGVNLSVVTSSVLTASLIFKILNNYFPDYKSAQPIISTLLVGPIILMFGEIVPLSIGRLYNTTLALKMAKFIKTFYYILFIIIAIATRISWLLGKITGTLKKENKMFSSIDEIKSLFEEGVKEGDLKKDDLNMLLRILNFKKNTASDIMCPLIKINMIEANKSITELIELIQKTGHSKIPVYYERVDNVIGIANIKGIDLKTLDLNAPVKTIMTKPYFIPETKPIKEILKEMKINYNHFAVVVNEFGGVSGIVTIEDIVEEVLGEIEDEFNKTTTNLELTNIANQQVLDIDAELELSELSEKLNIDFDLPDETEITTVAGYILYKLGKIPPKGMKLEINEQIKLTILDADDRRIIKVRLELK